MPTICLYPCFLKRSFIINNNICNFGVKSYIICDKKINFGVRSYLDGVYFVHLGHFLIQGPNNDQENNKTISLVNENLDKIYIS